MRSISRVAQKQLRSSLGVHIAGTQVRMHERTLRVEILHWLPRVAE